MFGEGERKGFLLGTDGFGVYFFIYVELLCWFRCFKERVGMLVGRCEGFCFSLLFVYFVFYVDYLEFLRELLGMFVFWFV